MGGTKNPDLAAIRAARPDLVFCNAEENRGEDIEALRREFAVDVSHPRTVAEIPALLRHFGAVAGRREESEKISLKVEEALERVEEEARLTGTRFRLVYLIWKDPWMTVGPRTYVADLLRRVGGSLSLGESSIADVRDYPVASENAILLSRPDVVILPDEPYPFAAKDAAFWRERLPASCRVVLVDGRRLLLARRPHPSGTRRGGAARAAARRTLGPVRPDDRDGPVHRRNPDRGIPAELEETGAALVLAAGRPARRGAAGERRVAGTSRPSRRRRSRRGPSA